MRNNRSKLHRFETDLWDRCFEKNRKRMRLVEIDTSILQEEI
ncbi:hypothetical protein LEP1GSC034_3781 [Leptospira interrogans str. 2003000735]|uniref:Uncharacterized protein n=5 Tax=Leptospira interrogans TaxID=173 RepID=A0A0E2D944_LEPIR|nr:hypothetical protein LEP1GSC027_1513 [Leptospira interrogans str. 2002000624]EKQ36013.1 hypothetical protein LEP1GSC025_0528 [Leptospira interrogans str. 2002000621]EKQ50085.1 hypothetical protein LEP1GSC026_1546 [Leptospira interrogans str. 2002000623]EKR56592.1 hypothetical protein LEP1GSC105_4318 [Leptospira interrogans str. UI 12758]EMF40722.1 hypothetical protein LEP1GSC067_3149 [Leptospira interrogans serovar Lora str. TE 1992]EMJ36902.1 hypothetical protein LEP1GSC079_0063 [Leptospir